MTKTKQPIILFLLGDPTSGKSTHGKMLSKDHRLAYGDIGTSLNSWRKTDRFVDSALKRTYDVGKLAPTGIVRKLYRKIVAELPKSKGMVFGGNPKMLGEAELLYRLFKAQGRTNLVCLYLTIPRSEILMRTQNRAGYEGKKKRVMDTPKALQKRLAFWDKDVARVVVFWKKRIPFIKLSSNAPTKLVHKKIEAKLKPYL